MAVLGDIQFDPNAAPLIDPWSTGPADLTFDTDLTRPSAGSRVANAAGALGVALAGDNTAGHAATVISLIPHPAAQGVAAVLGVVSHFEAKSEAREAKRRATAVVIKNVRVVDNPNIPICYGMTAVEGNRSFIKLQDSVHGVPAVNFLDGLDRSVWGTFGDETGGVVGGEPNEMLVFQKVISAGEIQTLSAIRVNDSPIEQSMSVGQFDRGKNAIGVCKVSLTRNAASAWDAASRGAGAAYTGLSYVDVVCQMVYSDESINKREIWRQGSGVPVTLFFVLGVKMKSITDTGLTTEVDWTPNSIKTIADYLTSPHYGPGLNTDRLHYPSWKAAQDACDVVWQGRGNAIWTNAVGKSLEGIVADSDQVSGTYQDNYILPRWGWISNGSGFDATQKQGSAKDDAGQFAASVSGSYRPASIRRAEFNGNSDSTLEFYDALDEMTNTVPGMLQFWGHDGKLKLSIPNPWQARADAPVRRITADERVDGVRLSVMKPDVKDVLTSVLVTYNSRNHGYKPQTFLWPYAGSAEEAALLRLSGGKRHQLEVRAPGIHNRLHAACIAKALCSYSNRRKVVDTVFWGVAGQAFEPGDVYEFEDAEVGDGTYIARLDSVETNFDVFQSTLMATEYYPSDYTPPLIQRETEPAASRAGRIISRTSPYVRFGISELNIKQGGTGSTTVRLVNVPAGAMFSDTPPPEYTFTQSGGLTVTVGSSPEISQDVLKNVTIRVPSDATVGDAIKVGAKLSGLVTLPGLSEQRLEYSSLDGLTVNVQSSAAEMDSGKPLRVKLQALGDNVYQARTSDGDGTAKSYSYDVLPTGAATVVGSGDTVRVTGNTFAGELVVAVSQSGSVVTSRSPLAYGGFDGPPPEGVDSPRGPLA